MQNYIKEKSHIMFPPGDSSLYGRSELIMSCGQDSLLAKMDTISIRYRKFNKHIKISIPQLSLMIAAIHHMKQNYMHG